MAATTDKVLRDEANAIHSAKFTPKLEGPALYLALGDLSSAALCLSGGGIRSAAFGLGVIQALAANPRSAFSTPEAANRVSRPEESLLAQFHYLSTVSGGGYIGGWLSAWRLSQPYSEIWANLTSRPDSPDREALPISWIRSYTNYLTPRVGFTSTDTWTAAALAIRNLVLNWFVMVPVICAVILSLKLTGFLSMWIILWTTPQHWTPFWDQNDGWSFYLHLACETASALAATVCLIVALAFIARNRPAGRFAEGGGPNQFDFIRGSAIWSFLSAFFLIHFLASDLVGNLLLECKRNLFQPLGMMSLCWEHDLVTTDGWNQARYPKLAYVGIGACCGAVVYALSWLIGRPNRQNARVTLSWTISGSIYGAIVASGLYLYLVIPDQGIANLPVYFLHIVFGIPWILFAQCVAETIFVGLCNDAARPDPDAEWFGRTSGWLLAIAMAWLIMMFLVFFGPLVTPQVSSEVKVKLDTWIPAIAGASGVIAGLLGASNSSIGNKGPKRFWSKFENTVFMAVALVFSAALVVSLSYGLDYLLFGDALAPPGLGDPTWCWGAIQDVHDSLWCGRVSHSASNFSWRGRTIGLLLGLLFSTVVAVVASKTVNINRFSLHTIYRNRLVRAFLGAFRRRTPDRLTGFDSRDNPAMHELWSKREPGNWRPFHVINVALNIVNSERLAWQERKAESFTISPLHSGSGYLCYRKTRFYGGPNGISLGTAMAISGAAASPNMGYYSSPGITFLMSMFNLRLGWWLGNPIKKRFAAQGPDFAIIRLVQEAMGLTNDHRDFVYLSDGGHFENLGLYEMVRRRCRLIVVSDAGCDPDFTFEDLGNAVRKIEIDLGVSIHFHDLQNLKARPRDGSDLGPGYDRHAIGEIDYRAADGAKTNGWILYIKASYHGTEGAPVLAYAKSHTDFPHESTSNQWFSESQFEAYRALGFEIADNILSSTLAEARLGGVTIFEHMFGAILTDRRDKGEATGQAAAAGA